MTKILKDEDLVGGALMVVAIDALETAFLARADNRLISPPRHHVSFPDRGDLVFTVGGILGEKPLAGFRVYETFEGVEHSQMVAVWSADDAKLKGIILGERLGNLRTGAIGGSPSGISARLTPASSGSSAAERKREPSFRGRRRSKTGPRPLL